MNVWVLKDGDNLRTGLGGRVAMGRIASYADVCEHHVCDYQDEEEAKQDARDFNREASDHWEPHPMDFSDVNPEDFDEHFEDD